jgi:hypothetical protein
LVTICGFAESWKCSVLVADHDLLRSISALLLAIFAILGAPTALARDARCPRLTGQLAALQGGGAGAQAKVQQYQNAIDRQNQEYERTLDYVRSIGCDLDPEAGNECRALDGNLQRMRRNLDNLQAQYQRLSDNAGQNREDERQRLQAMIEDLGCNGAVPPSGTRRSAGLFESLFGPDEAAPGVQPASPTPLQEGDLQNFNVPEADERLVGRTLRTICVRKCDGFYFPISFATDSSHFEQDTKACAQQCPTAEVELFAYDTYAQQPDEAISTSTGQTLKEMPNAFRFRTSFDAACTCKAAGTSVAQSVAPAADALKRLDEATLDAAAAAKKPAKPTGLPATAPAPAQATPADPGRTIETTTASGEKKRIRVVGPQSMPAQ